MSTYSYILSMLAATTTAFAPPFMSPKELRVAKRTRARTANEWLRAAQAAEAGLDYDKVLVFARRARNSPGASDWLRVQALLLEGTALVIIGREIDAELAFSAALDLELELDLPKSAPPKAVAVFRMVQVEAERAAKKARAQERAALLNSIALAGGPTKLLGGQPATFDYSVSDPRDAVHGVRVFFRRRGDPAFSSLALEKDDRNRWRAQIPGEWTSNEDGFLLEYFTQTVDSKGNALVAQGSETGPLSIPVPAGVVEQPVPVLKSTWFWVAVGGAALAATAAGLIVRSENRQLPGPPPLLVP
ncbi:MAG: hypothetical protein AAFX94_07870 [Myxococcota bacterium]